VKIQDGRTPFEIFRAQRFLGNSRIAPCSKILKQKVARKFIESNYLPSQVTLFVGIDWSEIHRLPKIKTGWLPFTVEAPLCEPPYGDKLSWMVQIQDLDIEIPSLYSKGFPHNNCGGGCVRAGKAQWRKLLQLYPDRFSQWENHEQEMREMLGKDITILRNSTLKELRASVEKESEYGIQIDLFDFGGCGCFSDFD